MNSQYEKGMTWDSRYGLDGMHTLDARPNEFGESTDTYMKAEAGRISAQDTLVGSAIVALVDMEAA